MAAVIIVDIDLIVTYIESVKKHRKLSPYFLKFQNSTKFDQDLLQCYKLFSFTFLSNAPYSLKS